MRPSTSFRRILEISGLCWAVWCCVPLALAAQAAYSAANGDASIVPINFGFMAADFAEAKLAMTFTQRLDRSCGDPSCVPDQFNFSIFASVAARKHEEDLFSKLNFEPGYDLGGRVGYVIQREGTGYDLVYVGGSFTSQARHTIQRDPDTGENTLSELKQRTFVGSVGFNHAFSEVTVVGVGLEGRRELSSPGVQLAQEYCTPGVAANGLRVLVCRDRFIGPLADYWAGQARMDLTVRVARFGSGPHAGRLGIISAASVDWLEGTNRAVNFAIGPSLHVAGYPGHTVAALLFGLRDAFDANGLYSDPERSYLADHLMVRLVLGAPFRVMVGN